MQTRGAASLSRQLHRHAITPFQCRSLSSSVPKAKASRSGFQLKTRLSWSFRKSDLDIAKTNALLRKCDIAEVDFARLESFRSRFEEVIQQRGKLDSEAAKVGKKLQEESQEGRETGDASAEKSEEITATRAEHKDLKNAARKLSQKLDELHEEAHLIMIRLPNMTHPDVPIGGEREAVMIGKGGDSKLISDEEMRRAFERLIGRTPLKNIPGMSKFSKADIEKDHLVVAQRHGWMDRDADAAVAGSGWPILQGPLAILEHILVTYGMDVACKAGFKPVVVPDVVKTLLLNKTGFQPREGGGGQTYWLSIDGQKEEVGLALAATAEIPLAGMMSGVTYMSKADLPVLYVASSHAFRAEAGARGKESRGLYRVHQFTKVELFVISRPAQSHEWLEKLRELQEEIIGGLAIPYRVLDMPTEELGASAYRKYDIEAWMPGRGKWGEISSASNCTEYQARRLGIKYREGTPETIKGGRKSNDFVHTLNGTAVAVPRLIVALVENYGVTKDGKLRLPSILKKYCFESTRDQIEWIDSELRTDAIKPTSDRPSTKATIIQRALMRIQSMSKKTGTDTASMVLSFMILHELTAIVPLILLFYLLGLLGAGEQVMVWLLNLSGEDDEDRRGWLRSKIDEGMQRAESYGRRKGYFGFEAGSQSNEMDASTVLAGTFANAVAAYAITKALFPIRIAACIALAGPFARVFIEPIKRVVAKRRRAKPV